MTGSVALREGRPRFARGLVALLGQHGATVDEGLVGRVEVAVDAMLEALGETAVDGSSLAPLDVVRIRANKLAAVELPPAVWREPRTLAALRAAIFALARAWLGPDAAGSGRFGGPAAT